MLQLKHTKNGFFMYDKVENYRELRLQESGISQWEPATTDICTNPSVSSSNIKYWLTLGRKGKSLWSEISVL